MEPRNCSPIDFARAVMPRTKASYPDHWFPLLWYLPFGCLDMAEGLKRLLETEAELDALLESTKRRAAELVEAARTEAESRVRLQQSELEKRKRALEARLEAECESSIREVMSNAEREVKRLDGLSEDTISELGRHVVGKLVGASPGGGS